MVFLPGPLPPANCGLLDKLDVLQRPVVIRPQILSKQPQVKGD